MITNWEDLSKEEKQETLEWWELKERIGNIGRIYTCFVEDRLFFNELFKDLDLTRF